MIKKYEVTDQVTGLPSQVNTFEEALQLQEEYKTKYMEMIKQCFAITVLTQNEDGSWTQSLSDNIGNPIVNDE
jgi:RNase H-fold protein (predicted Holliday junction resolvase)